MRFIKDRFIRKYKVVGKKKKKKETHISRNTVVKHQSIESKTRQVKRSSSLYCL